MSHVALNADSFYPVSICKNVLAQAAMAALTNGTASLSAKTGNSSKVTQQQTAAGKSNEDVVIDDPIDNHNISMVDNGKSDDTLALLRTFMSSRADVLASNAWALAATSKQNSDYVKCRISEKEFFNDDDNDTHALGLRRESRLTAYFVPSSDSTTSVSVDVFVARVVQKLDGSQIMKGVLGNCKFIDKPNLYLKHIFLAQFRITGFLSNASSTCEADVGLFLLPNESIDNPHDIVKAQVRLLTMLAYILGPKAYRHWRRSFHEDLDTAVSLGLIHAATLRSFCNNQVQWFFSATVTEDIKSHLLRGGTIEEFVIDKLVLKAWDILNLKSESANRLTSELMLRPLSSPSLSPLLSPGPKSSNTKTKSKDTSKNPKVPSALSGLKGFCLTWMQSDTMPCSNTLCVRHAAQSSSKKRGLKHRVEFDALDATQRAAIVAEAKKVAPAGSVVQVQA